MYVYIYIYKYNIYIIYIYIPLTQSISPSAAISSYSSPNNPNRETKWESFSGVPGTNEGGDLPPNIEYTVPLNGQSTPFDGSIDMNKSTRLDKDRDKDRNMLSRKSSILENSVVDYFRLQYILDGLQLVINSDVLNKQEDKRYVYTYFCTFFLDICMYVYVLLVINSDVLNKEDYERYICIYI
jgi:hypothetical protein